MNLLFNCSIAHPSRKILLPLTFTHSSRRRIYKFFANPSPESCWGDESYCRKAYSIQCRSADARPRRWAYIKNSESDAYSQQIRRRPRLGNKLQLPAALLQASIKFWPADRDDRWPSVQQRTQMMLPLMISINFLLRPSSLNWIYMWNVEHDNNHRDRRFWTPHYIFFNFLRPIFTLRSIVIHSII